MHEGNFHSLEYFNFGVYFLKIEKYIKEKMFYLHMASSRVDPNTIYSLLGLFCKSWLHLP